MKYSFLPFLTFFALVACSGERRGVQTAFDDYKEAILSQDGEWAANAVNSKTIDLYQNYTDWVRELSREELEQLSFINRFQVLILRHRIPHDLLLAMDGREAFIYAVDHDWIGKSGVVAMKIRNIEVAGNRATSDALVSGSRAPYKFLYEREEGVWKFDVSHIVMNTNDAFKQVATQNGLSENEFILQLLETISGKKPSDSIWEPIASR